MAERCRYAEQLAETARLVAEAVGVADYSVAYQSRSGPPHVPWLEPDVCDHLRELRQRGVTDVVVSPVGFVSDHLEVLYDLDVEAVELGKEIGVNVVRAGTAGTHPAFVSMIRELIQERLDGSTEKRVAGRFGPNPDVCPTNCCLPGTGKPEPVGRPSRSLNCPECAKRADANAGLAGVRPPTAVRCRRRRHTARAAEVVPQC